MYMPSFFFNAGSLLFPFLPSLSMFSSSSAELNASFLPYVVVAPLNAHVMCIFNVWGCQYVRPKAPYYDVKRFNQLTEHIFRIFRKSYSIYHSSSMRIELLLITRVRLHACLSKLLLNIDSIDSILTIPVLKCSEIHQRMAVETVESRWNARTVDNRVQSQFRERTFPSHFEYKLFIFDARMVLHRNLFDRASNLKRQSNRIFDLKHSGIYTSIMNVLQSADERELQLYVY